MLWNLTSRSPLRLARDIASAARRPASLAQGLFHFVTGLLLLAGGAALLLPLVARGRDFLALETLALLASLAVDQLIGADLRGLSSSDRST